MTFKFAFQLVFTFFMLCFTAHVFLILVDKYPKVSTLLGSCALGGALGLALAVVWFT